LVVSIASISWLLISTVMLIRLAMAWRRLAHLRRTSTVGEPTTLRLCHQLASRLGVAEPEVLHSPFLRGPFLVGLCRPAVLLPETERGDSARDTLIHELAHLCRRDCQWNLVQQFALSVYFFQPLLWMLSRRLEVSAEEVCDDYVVQFGSNREGYANGLVRIAELSSPPLALASVGIVSHRSMLARRIGRIMDTSRPLSTRAGNLLLTLTIVGGLIGVTCVGLIGTGPRSTLAGSAAGGNGMATDDNANTTEDAMEKTRGEKVVAVHGQIVDSRGRPLAAAHVAAIGRQIKAHRGGELQPRGEVLAEARTDESGKYALSLQGVSSRTHRDAKVIARIDGCAMAWQTLNLDAADTEISLKLPAEEVIRCQLVDSQKLPAADVRLVASSVMRRRSPDAQWSHKSIGFDVRKVVPAAWLPPVTSDGEGRFTLRGIPTGHGAHLCVEGSERFAPQFILLNTGASEKRGKRDGTYRAMVKNYEPGEEAILTLAPAQVFEGVVRYADTGRPAPHARLTIWASQQAPVGSMVSVAGTANAEGRYRISPNPGIRFGVTAYPPAGTAYLARRTPYNESIQWKSGDKIKRVDMLLPRGVLVRGNVVEAGTDTPVVGATIQYVPESKNNTHKADDILTGWQGIQLSDEDGRFEIAILPGPGRLLVHGPQGRYVLNEISDGQLSEGRFGGGRKYAHAIHKVDVGPDAEPGDITVELKVGATIVGRIVDEAQQSVMEVIVISRLKFFPSSLYWRGFSPVALGGTFQLSGLAEGQEYPTFFLDAKRRLGATAVFNRDSDHPTVVLKPCGEATVRITNPAGQPVVGFAPGLRMVVTPGVSVYDLTAVEKGKLAADADFVSNIDRTNYWPGPKTDNDGVIRFPALIPGATYRLATFEKGKPVMLREFTVKPSQTLDLGEVAMSGID